MNNGFRKIDELTVNAQFRARNIYDNFIERMNGSRIDIEELIRSKMEVENASTEPGTERRGSTQI